MNTIQTDVHIILYFQVVRDAEEGETLQGLWLNFTDPYQLPKRGGRLRTNFFSF